MENETSIETCFNTDLNEEVSGVSTDGVEVVIVNVHAMKITVA